MPEAVRPTKRALTDVGVTFPPLTHELHNVPHPVVEHAQRIPKLIEAAGAERIRDLDDRVWFKVKTTAHRGAAGHTPTPDEFGPDNEDGLPPRAWWLVAAGERQADTKNRDFYACLVDECKRAGKGSGSVSTAHLLPAAIDHRRWQAERAALAIEAIKRTVREAIARSAQAGGFRVANMQKHTIGALVQSLDGETYLAVAAEGFLDHKLLAIILSSVPEIPVEDWLAEPGPIFGIEPDAGQFVFSTILPATALSTVLEEVDGQFL